MTMGEAHESEKLFDDVYEFYETIGKWVPSVHVCLTAPLHRSTHFTVLADVLLSNCIHCLLLHFKCCLFVGLH